jgi:hypothetical protein
VAFRVNLRLRSLIIIFLWGRSCEQTTKHSRTLECNRNSRGEKSGENGEKSGMHEEKAGENGECLCMDTLMQRREIPHSSKVEIHTRSKVAGRGLQERHQHSLPALFFRLTCCTCMWFCLQQQPTGNEVTVVQEWTKPSDQRQPSCHERQS